MVNDDPSPSGSDSLPISASLYGKKIVLVSCGSFNPPTFAHLRMFERSKNFLEHDLGLSVVEGIISPVADAAKSPNLIPSYHRMKMVELAIKNSKWIRVDSWECTQSIRTPVLQVLKHFKDLLSSSLSADLEAQIHVMLLCGSDVLDAFGSSLSFLSGNCFSWNMKDLEDILRDFGMIAISRPNTNPTKAIYMLDLLRKYQKNIYVVEDETFPTCLNSTKIRTALRRGESIRYCINDEVVDYIEKHGLYQPLKKELKSGLFRESLPQVQTSAHRPTLPSTPPSNHRPKEEDEKSIEEPTPPPSKESTSNGTSTLPPRPQYLPHLRTHLTVPASPPRTRVFLSKDQVLSKPPSPPRTPKMPKQRVYSSDDIMTEPCTSAPRILTQKISESESFEEDEFATKSEIQPPRPPKTSLSLKLGSMPNNLDSPNYENVTLDEILEASAKWAEYLRGQTKRKDTEDWALPKPHTLPEPPVMTQSLTMEIKKSYPELCDLYCGRTLTCFSPTTASTTSTIIKSEREPSYTTTTTSEYSVAPENINPSQIPYYPYYTGSFFHYGTAPNTPKPTSPRKSIRFGSVTTKSAEDLSYLDATSGAQLSDRLKKSTVSKDSMSSSTVSLTFRQYRLTATPETTV